MSDTTTEVHKVRLTASNNRNAWGRIDGKTWQLAFLGTFPTPYKVLCPESFTPSESEAIVACVRRLRPWLVGVA